MAIAYNAQNRPKTITQPNGGVWEYDYDERGNLTERTNPLGAATQFEYNDGLVKKITNPLGAATHLGYNNQCLLKEIILPNATRVAYNYDLLGRVITITAPNGNTLHRAYNLLGKATKVSQGNGNTTVIQYDSMGNAVQVGDRFTSVALRYNFFGDVKERRQGNTAIEFIYDTEGQLCHVLNEDNERYSFDLDEEGNVITETGFDGLTRRYLRNGAGQVVRTTLPDGHQQAYEYTAAGRIATVYYEKDGTAETFGYDAMAQLTSAENKDAQVLLQRNLLGLIEAETSNGHTIASRYNLVNQRTGLQSSLGADISLQYNAGMNWLEQLTATSGHPKLAKGSEGVAWQTQFVYNSWGQQTERHMTGGVIQQNRYDKAGRLTGQAVQKGNRRLQRQYSWEGDRLTGIQDSATGNKQFKHDVYGNLTEVIYGDGQVEYRMPDAVGNLFETKDRTDANMEKAAAF